MSAIQQHDFGIWPRWLTEGRKAQEQVVITYLWSYAIEGKEWTLSELRKVCGCTVDRKLLDSLVSRGVLEITQEEGRKNSKQCHEYAVVTDLVPERDEKAPERPKKGLRLPPWVFEAVKIWLASQGIVGPKKMHNYLKLAVQVHGREKVLTGLERYARTSDKKFNPSPSRFVQNMHKWTGGGSSEAARPRSFADMEKE